MGARQITRKGLAHLWSFVELDRMTPGVTPVGVLKQEMDAIQIRINIGVDFVKFVAEHHGREPQAIVVSRKTYDILTFGERNQVLFGDSGTPIVVVDGIPDGVGVLAE